MRCVWAPVVLLVLLFVQISAAYPYGDPPDCKVSVPVRPCSESGWFRINDKKCIKFFKTKKTFDDAEKHCLSVGAHLVSVHSDEETNQLICLIMRTSSTRITVWIGVQRVGTFFKAWFAWTDGSDFSYKNWHYTQPDNHFLRENCVEVNFLRWGLWNDLNCGYKKPFVCAKPM
ncbi:C-type isolectin Sp-CL4-like [Enoplosus armatus]|uniref:C-type isolectin Sp-CL4-like n=1 Tax=Enoplosus armatus TaxID=215367 RepID=UPI003993E904